MSKKHELKILKQVADAISRGEKTFEVRKNDRNFEAGDIVEFTALSTETLNPEAHPINGRQYKVGYVLRFEDFPAGLQEGFAVFTIKESKERKKADFAEEAIRCAICRNPNANERGCDGACQVDEKKLESILEQINGQKEEPQKWREETDDYSFYYECPVCFGEVGGPDGDPEAWGWHYCPECGARLEGVTPYRDDEEEDA